MNKYELLVTTVDGRCFVKVDNLPAIMKNASEYTERLGADMVLMQVTNLQTGEVLAAWRYDPTYGLTAV